MNKKRVKKVKKKGPQLLGLFDVATELNISIDTARRYAKSGRLPSIRVAGRIRVPREAVMQAQREGL
jgi:excisionase family DNA binding protein